MRTAPIFLSFTNPQAWTDIYGDPNAAFKTTPKNWRWYGRPRKEGESKIKNTPTDDYHAKAWRIFAGAVSDRALKFQEPLLRRHVDKMVYNIHELISKEPLADVVMVQMYNFLAFDVMSDLGFGYATGMLDNDESNPWLNIVYEYVKATNLLVAIRFYHILRPFVGFVVSRQDSNARDEHFRNSASPLNERLRRGRDEPNIWTLVETRSERLLTNGEIHANAAVFTSAGTETIATQLCGITYLLLSHPRQLERPLREIRSSQRMDDLSLERLAQLPYLDACLKGLCLYPPIAEGLLRRVARDSRLVLGYQLSPGTSIYTSQYATSRNSANLEDPDLFRPERWLPMSGYDINRRRASQPFSTGPRDCLGKSTSKPYPLFLDMMMIELPASHIMRCALILLGYCTVST